MIVGAGPAGVRAAEVLAAVGLRPVLVDENQRAGGQIYRQPPAGFVRSAKQLYGFESAKADALHHTFSQLLSHIDYRPETLVWNCDGRQLDLLDRGQQRSLPYSHLMLCTGAIDRVLPFPGWLLPGVYTLGAAQVALKAQGCVIGSRIVMVGSGPLLYLLAYQYAKAGASIAAVLDTSSFSGKLQATADLLKQPLTLAKGLYFLAWLRCHGVKVVEGVDKIAVSGEQKVKTISWHKNGREQTLECDAVASGFGLRSETQLADLAGCVFEFNQLNQQWLPQRDLAGRSSVKGVYLAGDGGGIAGADAAELAGKRAALALLEDLGKTIDPREGRRLDRALQRIQGFRRGLERAFPAPVAWARECADEEIICRCEEITAGELRRVVNHAGTVEMNRLKALTRVGMGRCQGRVCSAAAAEILACSAGKSLTEIGRLRGQPPIKPFPVVVGVALSSARETS
ncbi:pyridine nucleotide-disulfide oxidoreductase family protein [Collimonas arenae]|nr:pyridine nucleotide-disulfide oxidoreductase family protein [Collimonas arenae]